MNPLVTGEILFDEACAPFAGATIYVRLQDVTRADASAKVVAELTLNDVSFDPHQETGIPFAIEGDLPSARASYAVAVHVDVDNDGKISKGDFLSTQSYPVLTHGFPDKVRVQVTRI